MKDVDENTTQEELTERLSILQDLISEKVIRMSNFKSGSLHFAVGVSELAADWIDELFDLNDHGEHVVPDLLDPEVRDELQSKLCLRHAAKSLLVDAMELFESEPSWDEFYGRFWGAEGKIRQSFPDSDSRKWFEQTDIHRELLEMLTAIRSLRGHDTSTERMVTVRLPKSQHDSLRLEADERGVSMNRLAISKLLLPIEDRHVARHSIAHSYGTLITCVREVAPLDEPLDDDDDSDDMVIYIDGKEIGLNGTREFALKLRRGSKHLSELHRFTSDLQPVYFTITGEDAHKASLVHPAPNSNKPGKTK
jgi:predicted HicB family RNase H-like nuclease